jgi:hypothetical protein
MPDWMLQTRDFVTTEFLAWDMDGTDKFEMLDEEDPRVRTTARARRARVAAWLVIPLLLLLCGLWALASHLQDVDASSWTHRFSYETNEIRQEGRQQYLLGVGKADITG